MPMGGLGTRTSDVYEMPKPFIRLYDKYLFEYSLDGLKDISKQYHIKLTMIVRSEIMNKQYIKAVNEIGWNYADEFNLIQIPELTKGPLETVMKASNLIDENDICIILDCDLWFKSYFLEDIINDIDENESYDGLLLSFNSISPKYSYASVKYNNIVTKTAEKNPISNNALAGVYIFSNGLKFKKYAYDILNKPIDEYDKNEYYTSYVYNLMIQDGAKIKLLRLDEYYSIGTSEEIEIFKENCYSFKKLYITDFDGTLFDTKIANYEAYKETFIFIYNYYLTEKEYFSLFGLRLEELLCKLNLDVSKVNEVRKMKAEVYKKYFDKININFDLLSFLYYKKKQGNIINLATTASRKNVENILNFFEISNLFDYIITGEDVQNGKPDPEVYDRLIDKNAKIELYNINVFEDSDVGIIAAHRTVIPDKNIIDINKNSFNFNLFISKEQFDKKRNNIFTSLL